MICSCALMFKFFYTPPDGASTEYQISNREFSDFLRTYYCDFLSNVYRHAGFFSVVIMGNVTHILPVLHCLKRGIAFVQLLLLLLYCCVLNGQVYLRTVLLLATSISAGFSVFLYQTSISARCCQYVFLRIFYCGQLALDAVAVAPPSEYYCNTRVGYIAVPYHCDHAINSLLSAEFYKQLY